MHNVTIRKPSVDDVSVLPQMQVNAGRLFRELDMASVADGPAPADSEFASAVSTGDLLVAEMESQVVGFIRTRPLDGALHVDQVSVAPTSQGQGIGKMLMRAAEQSAVARGFDHMTLTTFRDVAFNGPFYRQLGWRELDEREWSPALCAERAEEAAAGLDAWPRVAMILALQ